MLKADGLDSAFIGVGSRCGQPDVAVYSVERALKALCEDGDMSWEEAREYFDFNVLGAWVGSETPIFVSEMSLKSAEELEDSYAKGG